MGDSTAFFYIDGIPTKGCWVDIDSTTDMDDVRKALAEAEVFDDRIHQDDGTDDGPTDEAREKAAEEYGGDILVADADGLAKEFLGSHGTFDLEELTEWLDYIDRNRYTEDVVAAYIEHVGAHYATTRSFEEAYNGTHRDKEEWAEEIIESFFSVPEGLESYINYEKFAHDSECGGDYFFCDLPNGRVVVFRNC